jgi:hypothetical protein
MLLFTKGAFSASLECFAQAELIQDFFYEFETLQTDRSLSSLKNRLTFPG